IGPDVVRVGRQIELGIVTHQLRYRDEFRNVSLRMKLESNGDVGRCRLAGIRMEMQAEIHLRSRLHETAGAVIGSVAVLGLNHSLSAAVGIDEAGADMVVDQGGLN